MSKNEVQDVAANSILIEATATTDQLEYSRVATGEGIRRIGNDEESIRTLETVKLGADAMVRSLYPLGVMVDALQKQFKPVVGSGNTIEAEVKLALEFSSEASAWVFKASGKGTLGVTIKLTVK